MGHLRHVPDHVDGVCFRVFAHAGLLARALCRRAGRQLIFALTPGCIPGIKFPHRSLLTLGCVATAILPVALADLIAALVVIRIMVQFLMQMFGLFLLRVATAGVSAAVPHVSLSGSRAAGRAGFRLYSLARPDFMKEIRFALVIAFVGIVHLLVAFLAAQGMAIFRAACSQIPAGAAVQ